MALHGHTDVDTAHPDPISPTDDDEPHSSNIAAAATETCTARIDIHTHSSSGSAAAPAESLSSHGHPSVHFRPPSLDMIRSEWDLMERVPLCRSGDSGSRDQLTPRARPKDDRSQWRCRYCDLKLPQCCRMKEHVRTHLTRLKQPCHTCGKRFTTNATLRRHIRQQHQPQARAPTAVLPAAAPSVAIATASDPAVPAVHSNSPTDVPSSAPAPVPAPVPAPTPARAPPDPSVAVLSSSSSPSCSSASASASAAPRFVPFDVVDTVQVYPAPGSDLRRCNSIVHTAFLRRSDVYPHLACQHIVYKTCNPALEST